MKLVLDKLKIDLQEAFEKTDIIVDDITFEEKGKRICLFTYSKSLWIFYMHSI